MAKGGSARDSRVVATVEQARLDFLNRLRQPEIVQQLGRVLINHPAMSPFGGVLRFALWLAAYVVLGLILAIFVQSLGNWLLS
jgi:hypothetical protein